MGDCRFCPPAPAPEEDNKEVFRLCGLLQDQPGMRDEKHITLLPGLCLTVISGLSCFSQGDQTQSGCGPRPHRAGEGRFDGISRKRSLRTPLLRDSRVLFCGVLLPPPGQETSNAVQKPRANN